MWPYFLPVVIIFFMQFRYLNVRMKNGELYKLIFCAVLLLLLAGMRGNDEGDYFNYIEWGREIRTFQDVLHKPGFPLEIGYRFLAWIIGSLHLPAQTIVIAMNLISICCTCIAIRRYSSDYMLSVFMFLPFFYSFDMHAARTVAAMGISMFSLEYVMKKKPVHFLGVLFLASAFHKEVWILVFLYPLMHVEIPLKCGSLVLGAEAVFVSLFGVDSMMLLLMKLPLLIQFRGKYIRYSSGADYGYAMKLYDPRFILYYMIFAVSKMWIKQPSKIEKLFINSSYFCIFLMIFFSEHTIFVHRLASFYQIYSILLVPAALKHKFRNGNIQNTMSRYAGCIRLKLISIGMFAVMACAYAYRLARQAEYTIFSLMYWHS